MYHGTAIAHESDSCLALGHLYSILECHKNDQVSVCVISTFTGEVILSLDFLVPLRRIVGGGEQEQRYPKLWGLLSGQEWINRCDSLPSSALPKEHLVAMEYFTGYIGSAHEIRSILLYNHSSVHTP